MVGFDKRSLARRTHLVRAGAEATLGDPGHQNFPTEHLVISFDKLGALIYSQAHSTVPHLTTMRAILNAQKRAARTPDGSSPIF